MPDWTLIQSQSGAAASFTFSSLGSYRQLMIIVSARGDTAATSTGLRLRCNGDTGANYRNRTLVATNTTRTGAEDTAATSIDVGAIAAANAPAGLIGSAIIMIPQYRNTGFFKDIMSRGGYKTSNASGGTAFRMNNGSWKNAAAITSITILPAAGSFVAGTIISVYGLS